MAEGKFIAYYRVSTDKQGRSGLGLEAQQAAVERYLDGGTWELLADYTEVESGKRVTNRPELQAALQHCRREKATLVIAKLDRLGRNVSFIASMMDSKVDFVCCDNPHANRLMLHMLAAFAEHEREQISKRTKAALAAAKARGVQLGNPKLDVLNQQHRDQAEAFAQSLAGTIEELRAEGHTTVRAIRDELNRHQVPTATGEGQWHIPGTWNLLQRIEALNSQFDSF